MKTPFTYTVLRYVHDIFTKEFINVGLIVYAPHKGFLKCKCTTLVSRATATFPHANSKSFKDTLRFVASRTNQISQTCFSEIKSDSVTALDIAKTIIPHDNSAFQWSTLGAGITDSPEDSLEDLYARLVGRYEQSKPNKKSDVCVWKPFEKVLKAKQVLARFEDVRVSYGDYDWHFEHAWKNGTWNVFQPVSFDLVEKRSIVEKAAHWSGRVKQLRKSETEFKIYLLLGKPKRPELLDAFAQAEEILRDEVPGEKEVVPEEKIAVTAERVADEILTH